MGCIFTKKKKLPPPPSRNITLKQIIAWEEFCKNPQNNYNRNIKSSPINIPYPRNLDSNNFYLPEKKCVGVPPNIPIPLFTNVNAPHIDN
jgi:hypothetical protein